MANSNFQFVKNSCFCIEYLLSSGKKLVLLSKIGFSFFLDINNFRLNFISKKYQGDLERAWQLLSREDLIAAGLNYKRAEEIILKKQTLSLSKFSDKLKKMNATVISTFDQEYPQLLKEIYDPPAFLYLYGDKNIFKNNALAIVGTRKPTAYGRNVVKGFVKDLKNFSPLIVSGLAMGIDAEAHRAALDNNLKTVAVLGTGIDVPYPACNKELYQQITLNGVVISEYPLGTPPLPWGFPRRNRIITGLVKSVLVVEGGVQSGALISGRLAVAQNRDVYALPGNITSTMSAGPNWLIDQGAKPFLSAEQFIKEQYCATAHLFKKNTDQKNIELTADENKIYELLVKEGGLCFDELLEATAFAYQEISSLVLALELKGLVLQLPGKKFMAA